MVESTVFGVIPEHVVELREGRSVAGFVGPALVHDLVDVLRTSLGPVQAMTVLYLLDDLQVA